MLLLPRSGRKVPARWRTVRIRGGHSMLRGLQAFFVPCANSFYEVISGRKIPFASLVADGVESSNELGGATRIDTADGSGTTTFTTRNVPAIDANYSVVFAIEANQAASANTADTIYPITLSGAGIAGFVLHHTSAGYRNGWFHQSGGGYPVAQWASDLTPRRAVLRGVTYDGTNIKLFENGRSAGSAAAGTPDGLYGWSVPYRSGTAGASPVLWYGPFGLWNRALSDGEQLAWARDPLLFVEYAGDEVAYPLSAPPPPPPPPPPPVGTSGGGALFGALGGLRMPLLHRRRSR